MKESYDPVDSHKNQCQQGVIHQGKPKEKIKEISDKVNLRKRSRKYQIKKKRKISRKYQIKEVYLTIGPYYYENFDRYL